MAILWDLNFQLQVIDAIMIYTVTIMKNSCIKYTN